MTEEQFFARYGSSLNDAQKEAVRAVDGAVLLLAVPGSGKTTVLVTRLGYMTLCRGIPPEQILTMTYTVAATREMGLRFSRMFGEALGSAVELRTINGLSQKIIDHLGQSTGRASFRLLDNEGELSQLIREIYRQVHDDYPTDSTIRDIRTGITYAKNRMLSPEEIRELDVGVRKFPEIFDRYCKTLRDNRQMDYDDQMQYALTILKKYPEVLRHYQQQYPYICVDESQDTSKIQHEIIRLLAAGSGNLFMVGDEDQSIYGFRAAYPEALTEFETVYPGARVLVMEQNYRSTDPILGAANAFVSRNRFRHPKQIRGTRGPGEEIHLIQVKDRAAQFRYLFELARDCREETAVLFRNNDSAVPLIDMLERSGIPYNCRRFEEAFFSHRVVADMEDIIRFAWEPTDADRFYRIYYKFRAPISRENALYACRESLRTGKPVLFELMRCPDLSHKTWERVRDLAESLEQLPRDDAPSALRRIRYEMGYCEFLDRNKLDGGKLDILTMVGRHLPSAMALLDRLEELQTLIRCHVNREETPFLLSTIHSSKGLEYERVYLLDVLDGILPMIAREDAHTPEEIREYEEERRLFYVAMTRARSELNLFRSEKDSSAFLSEILPRIPSETFREGEVLDFLSRNLCGKTFRHSHYGTASVIAQREDQLLLAFPDGSFRAMTLGEMIASREKRYGPSAPPAAEAQEKAPAVPTGPLRAGDPVEHFLFGTGTVRSIDIQTVTVLFDKDGKERSFLKSSVLPNGKLKHA